MMVLFPFAALFILIALLATRFRFRPSLSPVAACCMVVLALYAALPLGLLRWTPPAIVVLVCAYAAANWRRLWFQTNRRRMAATGATLLLVAVWAVILGLALHQVRCWHMDEFHIWVSRSKHLALYHTLEPAGGFFHHFYPPGAALFYYFFTNFTGHHEGVLFVANAFLILCALVSCWPVTTWRSVGHASAFLVCATIVVYATPLQFSVLQVDLLLAALFAAAMNLAARRAFGSRGDTTTLLLLCAVMPLIKQVGLPLAAVVVLTLVLRALFQPRIAAMGAKAGPASIRLARRVLVPALMLAAIFVAHSSWQRIMGGREDIQVLSGKLMSVTDLAALPGVVRQPETERQKAALANFGAALLQGREFMLFTGGGVPTPDVAGRLLNRVRLPIVQATVLFSLIGLALVLCFRKPRSRSAGLGFQQAAFLLGAVGFSCFYLFVYLFVLSEKEGARLAGHERYFAGYFVPWAICLLAALRPGFRRGIRGLGAPATTILVVTMLLLPTARKNWTDFWLDNPYRGYTAERAPFAAHASVVGTDTPTSSSVYVVYTGADQMFPTSMAHYDFMPRTVNTSGWWPGPVYQWAARLPMTAPELEQVLRAGGYGYLFAAQTDDEFWNLYSPLFDLPVNRTHKLFKVDQTSTGGVVLRPHPSSPRTAFVSGGTVVMHARDMAATAVAKPDDNGGLLMLTAGALRAPEVHVPFQCNRIRVEAKGYPALGVMPDFDIVTEGEGGRLSALLPRSTIHSPEYKITEFALPKPLPAGAWKFQLRYLNNSEGVPAGSKEDRNLAVRRITLVADDGTTGAVSRDF